MGVETPAPGACEATDPPEPDDLTGELAANESSRSYPSKPDMKSEAVRSFVETYEASYQYNATLAGNASGVPDGISRVDTWLRGSELQAVTDGYLVAVHVTINYGDDNEEPKTNSPAPSGHQPNAATYYITDRFLVRQSSVSTGELTLDHGRILECW